MMQLKQRWQLEAEADRYASAKVTRSWRKELDREAGMATAILVKKFDSLIARLAGFERSMLDVNDPPNLVIGAMRGALQDLRELQQLCRQNLPFVEREVVALTLDRRCQELEERLDALLRIVDNEDEVLAKQMLASTPAERVTESDRKLIAHWMLDRFMLRELTPPNSWILRFLLDWRCVVLWILSPFAAAVVIRYWVGDDPGRQWLVGVPFILVVVFSILLFACYFVMRTRFPAGLSRASFLLPQMIGTLFLGVMQSFEVEEVWYSAFLVNPVVRLLHIVIFLTASYVFVRRIMLKGQFTTVDVSEDAARSPQRVLRQRTCSILALGMWQAFFLVTLFSLLQGTVMGGAASTALAKRAAHLDALSQQVGEFVPHLIAMDFGAFTCLIVPWAILSWTIQLFFFGAIFERIMNR
jgi:hypothetical protein